MNSPLVHVVFGWQLFQILCFQIRFLKWLWKYVLTFFFFSFVAQNNTYFGNVLMYCIAFMLNNVGAFQVILKKLASFLHFLCRKFQEFLLCIISGCLYPRILNAVSIYSTLLLKAFSIHSVSGQIDWHLPIAQSS